MKVKYLMATSDDYRGIVALIARDISGSEVAYSEVAVKDQDMVDLIQAEIDLVEAELGHTWEDIREQYKSRITDLANKRRTDIAIGQDSSEYVESLQVRRIIDEWEAAGSPTNAVPDEIDTYATLNQVTPSVAVTEIRAGLLNTSSKITQIRNTRLSALYDLSEATAANLESTYNTYVAQLNAIT